MRLAFLTVLALINPCVAYADPAPQDDPLSYFAGTWRCDGVFPASGRTLASTLRFEVDGGSGALVEHHDDLAPGQYHALEAWSFTKNGGFSSVVVDRFSGVRVFASAGWQKDALTWSSQPNAAHAERFAYTRLTPNQMRLDWSMSRDGTKYVLGDTLTCNRT